MYDINLRLKTYKHVTKELRNKKKLFYLKKKKKKKKIGNNLILKNIPERIKINSIEFKPGFGAKIARSAGCYAYIISKNKDDVKILLKSGKSKILSKYCRATIGEVSNKNYCFIKHGK